MAFELPGDVADVPKYTIVSSYAVNRMGPSPTATLGLMEVSYVFALQAPVDAAQDLDGDGKFEVLQVNGLASLGDVTGKQLALADSTNVSIVKSATVTTVTPAVVDAQGIVTTPAVLALTLTLTTPSPADLTGQTVGIVQTNAMNGPTYRKPTRGREWTLVLNSAVPGDLARMSQAMGSMYVSAVAQALAAMEINSPMSQIETVVQDLALEGINIDSIWADQGAQVELDRRAKTFTPSTTMGQVPKAA